MLLGKKLGDKKYERFMWTVQKYRSTSIYTSSI